MAAMILDINTATIEDFKSLAGVGRTRAEAIVETRQVFHHFFAANSLNTSNFQHIYRPYLYYNYILPKFIIICFALNLISDINYSHFLYRPNIA